MERLHRLRLPSTKTVKTHNLTEAKLSTATLKTKTEIVHQKTLRIAEQQQQQDIWKTAKQCCS